MTTGARTLPPALGLLALLALAGCSSSAAEEAPPQPVEFVALAAPAVGSSLAAEEGDEDAEEGLDALTPEDVLLELATQLSGTGTALDFVLVAGPLLASADEEAHALAVGSLGQIAAPVLVGLGPEDGPRDELLEALGEGLRGHGGEPGQWGQAKEGWRPVALAGDGSWPTSQETKAKEKARKDEDAQEQAAAQLILVHAAKSPSPELLARARLIVVQGDTPALERSGAQATLRLPPVTRPPHVYARARIEQGTLHVQLLALAGDPPPSPPPLKLD